jgi:hypothetical protein
MRCCRLGLFWLLPFLVTAMLVWAHEGGVHVFGTLKSLEKDHMVVQTREGETVSIYVLPTTRYRNRGDATDTTRLKVGDRVVIDVTEEGDRLIASEVLFSSSGKKGGGTE